MNYLTYSYLLTPLHAGASSQAGNLLGIAREAQTQLPYLPASSIRGKLRSLLEAQHPNDAGKLLGERLKDGQSPTEGYAWFADATLLLFPVASFSHQFVWITCPLWLKRWNRWLKDDSFTQLIAQWQELLVKEKDDGGKSAIASVKGQQVYLQGAILDKNEIESIPKNSPCWEAFNKLPNGDGILDLFSKLLILGDDDCAAFVELGLQQEVRIAMEKEEKITKIGSFRSEQALPSETIFFFPWGVKPVPEGKQEGVKAVRESLESLLCDRLQFGGSESLGRGWTENNNEVIGN